MSYLTDLLDLAGLLLLVAAGALAAWIFLASFAGLAAAGVGVLGTSWLIDRRRKSVERSEGVSE